MRTLTRISPARSCRLWAGILLCLSALGRSAGAAGTWRVLTDPVQPGEALSPRDVAVDPSGNLYVTECCRVGGNNWLLKRNIQGEWSVVASAGTGLGMVEGPTAVALDASGNLFVADHSRVQKLDPSGIWALIAPEGGGLGEVSSPYGLALDSLSNLYVADTANHRVQVRDPMGDWSVVASSGTELGEVAFPVEVAVDGADALTVTECGCIGYSPHPQGFRREAPQVSGPWWRAPTSSPLEGRGE